ncbi:hypothetical protein P691DRAFT_687693, partial [Macrolepiota fuliginosa MF-IS2]
CFECGEIGYIAHQCPKQNWVSSSSGNHPPRTRINNIELSTIQEAEDLQELAESTEILEILDVGIMGPHCRDLHQSLSGCCKGNPKSTPPIPPTPADMACPNVCSCINCSAQHAVDDRCCSYWCHCFNHDWIKLQSTWDATARKAPTSIPTGPPPPLPSALPCLASHWPCSNAVCANSVPDTIQPPLPPPSPFPHCP